jgi:hypothetical protein
MPKTPAELSLEHYAPVADRLTLFYARYPNGRVVTELVSRDETEIIFRAFVYRSVEEAGPAATGWAAERIGDGDVNTVACLENTETSAVGRALANLGLTASRNRPSLEEMEKAARARTRVARDATGARPVHVVAEPKASALESPVQRIANRAHDALELLAEAEHAGLAKEDLAPARAVLMAPSVSIENIEGIERSLRRWLHGRLETLDARSQTRKPDARDRA